MPRRGRRPARRRTRSGRRRRCRNGPSSRFAASKISITPSTTGSSCPSSSRPTSRDAVRRPARSPAPAEPDREERPDGLRRACAEASRLHRRRARAAAEDDVPRGSRAPTPAASCRGRSRATSSARACGSRTELKIGSYAKSGSPGKYICVTRRCVKSAAEDREVDVRGPPRVLVVAPRVGAGLHRHEAVAAVVVGETAAGAGEVRVERRRMPVDLVVVAAGGVRLPHLDERAADRPPVLVEHSAGDDDPLAERLAFVLARQVVVAARRACPRRRPGLRARAAPPAA